MQQQQKPAFVDLTIPQASQTAALPVRPPGPAPELADMNCFLIARNSQIEQLYHGSLHRLGRPLPERNAGTDSRRPSGVAGTEKYATSASDQIGAVGNWDVPRGHNQIPQRTMRVADALRVQQSPVGAPGMMVNELAVRHSLQFFSQLVGRRLRVWLIGGRVFEGSLVMTDTDANLILRDTVEIVTTKPRSGQDRTSPQPAQPLLSSKTDSGLVLLGPVVIVGKDIDRMEAVC